MEFARLFRDDSLSPLLEPDLITPEQYRDRVGSKLADNPEARLMLAVMEEAVATYQRYAVHPRGRRKRLFQEVEAWINSPDASWLFSFESVCRTLHLEPEAIRRGLETWRATHLEQAEHGYRFPFRRVNARRHSVVLNDPREQRSWRAGAASAL